MHVAVQEPSLWSPTHVLTVTVLAHSYMYIGSYILAIWLASLLV